MELQTCGLNLNRVSMELQPHGSSDFPCAGYTSIYTGTPKDAIPWHWHKELEVIYIKKGSLQVQIPKASFSMEEGDCLAINSNILHYATTDSYCELQSFVFDLSFLAGHDDSIFAKKYLFPLISCGSFHGIIWSYQGNKEMKDAFCCAFEALTLGESGFEFMVREQLSKICLLLYFQFEKDIKLLDLEMNHDHLRIRKMLEFIHHHFWDHLSLDDIARAADIGQRECLRCFKRTIQIPPMQYLLKYRVTHGAKLLMDHPYHNVSDIATLCGFDSPSHFSKIFRRFYLCTPREYRSQNKR